MAHMFDRGHTQRISRDVSRELIALQQASLSEQSKGEIDDSKQPSLRDIADLENGYSIHDLLNGYVIDEDTLSSLDECLFQILSEWDLSDILSKNITDCEHLINTKCNTDHWRVLNSIVDPPSELYEMLLRLARKIKAISLVIGNQKMIYVPETVEELDDINSRFGDLLDDETLRIALTKTMRTMHSSARPKQTIHSVPIQESDDDDASFSEPEPAPVLLLGADSNKKGNLESFVFVNHVLYKESEICAQREKKYTKKMVNPLGKMKNLMVNPLDKLVVNPLEKAMKTQVTNNESQGQEHQSQHPMKAHPHHICCEGCGNLIKFAEDYDQIIVYTVPINGELFYFHDRFCVTLRRLKESIRRYVMDEQLPESSRSKTIVGYIRNLFMNFNTLITTKGVVPRPNPLRSKSKATRQNDEEEEQHSIIKFVRASAYTLILRQKQLEEREAAAKRLHNEYAWKFAQIPKSIQYTKVVKFTLSQGYQGYQLMAHIEHQKVALTAISERMYLLFLLFEL